MPARRLYVHIGLQKTGTTFLQAVLLDNREELAAAGLDLLPATKREAFELMLAVRDRYQPGRDPVSVTEALPRFGRELEQARGPRAVLSQESFAGALRRQVDNFLDVCGDREVHVVATVRDLARQIPSAWQQYLKSGRTAAYAPFLEELKLADETGRANNYWLHLDPPTILGRWADDLGPDRIHVVTVPPSGGAPTALLERFCRVLEVDVADLRLDDSPRNTGLGHVQAEVLRRVNEALPDEPRRRQVYGDLGKRYLASQVLRGQTADKIRVPTEFRGWVEEVSARQVAALAEAGYVIEGDLDDLRCLDSSFDDEPPPTDGEVADAAVAALTRVLELRADGGGRPRRRREPGRPLRRRLAARLRRSRS